MTERLYLADPYLYRFEAEVVARGRLGDRPAVVLSRTAFYPEGGGQPADLGTLGESRVVDVQEVEGEILHAIDGPVPLGVVTGEVDAVRRLDHLQQHHGQHLLSAAFASALGAHTVSFHLGREVCTIDLDLSADRLGPATLAEVERAANDLVWRDLPVEAREVAPEELSSLALRKDPTRGTRVVIVRDDGRGGSPPGVVDASPCGGTHPRRTGEVGAIAVLRAQRWGSGARVEFACGGRLVGRLHAADEVLARVASALRCAPAEAAGAAARLASEALEQRKELERVVLLLAEAEAGRLAARPDEVVEELAVPAGEPAAWLRAVAQALAARGRLALLGARGGGRALLCFARPRGPGPDLGAAMRAVVGMVGGKGGGAPELAQGGGTGLEHLEEALARARDVVGAPGPAAGSPHSS